MNWSLISYIFIKKSHWKRLSSPPHAARRDSMHFHRGNRPAGDRFSRIDTSSSHMRRIGQRWTVQPKEGSFVFVWALLTCVRCIRQQVWEETISYVRGYLIFSTSSSCSVSIGWIKSRTTCLQNSPHTNRQPAVSRPEVHLSFCRSICVCVCVSEHLNVIKHACARLCNVKGAEPWGGRWGKCVCHTTLGSSYSHAWQMIRNGFLLTL